MKEEIKKLLYMLKNKEDICKELQAHQDRVNPRNFRYYTEQLTYKLEDIIEIHELATISGFIFLISG